MKTNAKGEYQFATIKPAPYPGGMEPAHIHLVVKKKMKVSIRWNPIILTTTKS